MFFAGLPKAVAHCKTKRGENALNLAVRAGMVFESTPKILVFFQKKKNFNQESCNCFVYKISIIRAQRQLVKVKPILNF